MTQSDKWKKRKCVVEYWDFKDDIKRQAGDWEFPDNGALVRFYIPMPKSWSKKKKSLLNGQPHTSKPDLDNLLKALWDALLDEDCHVWDIGAMKIWSYKGKIEVY